MQDRGKWSRYKKTSSFVIQMNGTRDFKVKIKGCLMYFAISGGGNKKVLTNGI